MIKCIIIYLLLHCFCGLVKGQNNIEPKNRLSTSIYERETKIEPLNGEVQTNRFINGLYYQRNLSNNIHPSIGIEYGEVSINDNCIDCANNYYGKGILKEISFILGLNYNFLNSPIYFIVPFIQMDLFYSNSKFSGNYEGGFGSPGLKFEDIYDKYGVTAKIGFEVEVFKNLIMSLYTGYRSGFYSKQRINEESIIKSSYSNWIPVGVRIGVEF